MTDNSQFLLADSAAVRELSIEVACQIACDAERERWMEVMYDLTAYGARSKIATLLLAETELTPQQILKMLQTL
jgi:hypothetical protein